MAVTAEYNIKAVPTATCAIVLSKYFSNISKDGKDRAIFVTANNKIDLFIVPDNTGLPSGMPYP